MKSLILVLAIAAPLFAQITSYPTSQIVSGQMQVNQPNGVPGLDANGFIPYGESRIPATQSILRFRAALAAGSPAAIAFLGDSITQGSGASSNASGWANQSINKLTAKYGGASGNAFQNSITSGAGTFVGTWTGVPGVGPSQSTGTIINEVLSASASATVTMSGSADAIDVYYYTFTDSAAFGVTIDGSSKGTFGGTTTGSYTPGVATFTGLDPSASHTVVLTAPASGKVYFFGMSFHTGTSGIIGLNFADAGSTIQLIQQPQNVSFLSVIPNLSLIVCAMGANDGNSSGPTYTAKYASLIAQAQAINVPILFVITEQPSTLAPSDKVAIDNTIKGMATSNGYEWLSVYDRWGSYAAANALGLYADTIHPSQAGHNDISEMFTKYLMEYTGGSSNASGFGPYTFAPNGATVDLGSSSVNATLKVTGGAVSGQGIAIANIKNGGGGSMSILGDGSLRIDSVLSHRYSIGSYDFMHAGNGDLGIGTSAPTYPLDVALQTRFQAGMLIWTTTVQPTCTSATRGEFWVVQGATGVKDQVSVCAKDASDIYAWRTIY